MADWAETARRRARRSRDARAVAPNILVDRVRITFPARARRSCLAPSEPRAISSRDRCAESSSDLALLLLSVLPSIAQAAVVGVSTVLLASPAFAATIKLGGDNGELGFFVSIPPAFRAIARRSTHAIHLTITGGATAHDTT